MYPNTHTSIFELEYNTIDDYFNGHIFKYHIDNKGYYRFESMNFYTESNDNLFVKRYQLSFVLYSGRGTYQITINNIGKFINSTAELSNYFDYYINRYKRVRMIDKLLED